jgi:hypothetical protein
MLRCVEGVRDEAGDCTVEVAEAGVVAAEASGDEDIFSGIYEDLRRFAAVAGRVGDDPDDGSAARRGDI